MAARFHVQLRLCLLVFQILLLEICAQSVQGGPPARQDPTCDKSLATTVNPATLLAAAGMGNLDKVKSILDQELHPDSLDPDDPDLETALMRAASNNHHTVVHLLLERGADRFRQDLEGKTALMMAATLGRVDSVLELLKERPRVFDGSTEVALSGSAGNYAETRDKHGRTALLWASYNAQSETAKILVDSGADLEAADDTGRTPLMWAVTSASAKGLETAKLLLDSGASPEAEDNTGATAMGWAIERGSRPMVALVAKYQCCPSPAPLAETEAPVCIKERLSPVEGAYVCPP